MWDNYFYKFFVYNLLSLYINFFWGITFLSTRNVCIYDIMKVAFASQRRMASPRLFYDEYFLMVTSRFVCGEISRLIKLLRVSRNAQSRETIWRSHQGNTCRTHMNASSVFTRPFLFQLSSPSLSPAIPSFLHLAQTDTRTPSRSHSAFFLDIFALSM